MAKIYEFEGQTYELPDDATEQELHDFILGPQNQPNAQGGAPSGSQWDQFRQAEKDLTGNRTPVDTIRDLLSGAATGLGQGGKVISEQLGKIPGTKQLGQYVQGKTGISVPDVDVEQQFEGLSSPNKSIGGEFAKGIGSYLPYGMMGGPGLAGQLIGGAAHGYATTPENEESMFGEGREGGATKGALVNALTHGAFKGIEALRPSKLLRGNLSPEELKANLSAAEGTPTGLGSVIESPFLQRQYENVLTKMPFSGATEKLQEAGQSVVKRGEDILSNMLGKNSPEDVSGQLHKALVKQYEKHRTKKESLYDSVDDIAKENNLQPELSSFANALKRNEKVMDNMTLIKNDPVGAELFDRVASSIYGTPKVNPATGISVEPKISYKDANILKGRLNSMAKLAKQSPDVAQRSLAHVYEDLGKSLRKDVHDSVSSSNNSKLINSYNKAEENYRKNFSSFLDKDIYSFISGKKDPDTLVQSFIKSSTSADRSRALSRLTKTLQGKGSQKGKESQQQLLPYSYFSRALDNEGNLNPSKLATLIKKLGKNQFKALVPDPIMRKELTNYKKLHDMNIKGVNSMFNPETGQKNLDILPALLAHAGAGLSGGAAAGSMLGIPGMMGGAALGLAMPGMIARPGVKGLTSPQLRESLVKAMIENKKWDPKIIQALQTGAQGATSR